MAVQVYHTRFPFFRRVANKHRILTIKNGPFFINSIFFKLQEMKSVHINYGKTTFRLCNVGQ